MNDTASVLYAREVVTTVSDDIVTKLKSMALAVPLKRARLCLHLSKEDAVQEMVIALHRDTYIRPHRHAGKSESFHMIEGEVLIGFFDEAGEIQQTVHLTSSGKRPFLYRLSAPLWHTVIPLTEFAVFQEVTMGPFSASEFPVWEPENQPEAIERFKERVRSWQ